MQEAEAKSLRGEMYMVSAKIGQRLYARAASNVSAAHQYTMSYAPKKESYQSYVEFVENQKSNISQSLASTQVWRRANWVFVLASVPSVLACGRAHEHGRLIFVGLCLRCSAHADDLGLPKA